MLTSLISVLPQTSHVPSVLPGSLWHFPSPHTCPRLCLLFLSLFKPPTLSLPPQELLAENFASHWLRKLEQVSTITSTSSCISVCLCTLPSLLLLWMNCLSSIQSQPCRFAQNLIPSCFSINFPSLLNQYTNMMLFLQSETQFPMTPHLNQTPILFLSPL